MSFRWRMVDRGIRRLARNPTALVGLSIMACFLGLATLAPVLARPNAPNPYRLKRDVTHPLVPPGSPKHLLGTDDEGSDIFYGLVWGSRLSMRISLTVVVASVLVGTATGTISAYYGGATDDIVMRITDIFFAIPPYILAMAILASLGVNLKNLMTTLVVVFWPLFARVMRSQVLRIKATAYLEAAYALGAGATRVILRHVLPNSLAPLLVQGTLSIGQIVLWAAGLSFIGLAPSDSTEWGNMVSHGQNALVGGYWWPSLFPGLAIFFFVMGANLLGDGVRDVFDPRTQT